MVLRNPVYQALGSLSELSVSSVLQRVHRAGCCQVPDQLQIRAICVFALGVYTRLAGRHIVTYESPEVPSVFFGSMSVHTLLESWTGQKHFCSSTGPLILPAKFELFLDLLQRERLATFLSDGVSDQRDRTALNSEPCLRLCGSVAFETAHSVVGRWLLVRIDLVPDIHTCNVDHRRITSLKPPTGTDIHGREPRKG